MSAKTMPTIPADIRAERAAIGSCLIDRDAITVATHLPPEAFYLPVHAVIWQAILACAADGVPPDMATVASKLRQLAPDSTAGALVAMGECVAEVPTAVHIVAYVAAVERAAQARRYIDAGAQIQLIGYDLALAEPERAADLVEQIALEATRQPGRVGTWVSAAQMVNELFDHLNSPEIAALPTGLSDLDRLIYGWQQARLYVAAARPGMGKSGLALTAGAAACRRGARVGIFSLEMKRLEISCRLVAERTGIAAQRIQGKRLGADELPLVMDASGEMGQWRLFVDDISGQHISNVRAKVRRTHAAEPFDLIIVDYLQLIEGDGDNRVQEVGATVRGLKNLASELNVPILALAQLNRAVEGRSSKVPMLSDLRESGEIEQAADVVMFIHREEYYDPETDKRGTAELHLAKHRGGPLGVVTAAFDGPSTMFRNLSRHDAPEGY